MQVSLKYSIGDKVIFSQREYTIDAWKIDVKSTGIEIKYLFHAYLDPVVSYHQEISEKYLTESASEPHPCTVDLDFTESNGIEIGLGDFVFCNMVSHRLNGEKYIAWNDLTFAYYGTVLSFCFEFNNGWDYIMRSAWVSRVGPSVGPDGSPYRDGRREDRVGKEILVSMIKSPITDNLAQMYVDSFVGSNDDRISFINNSDSYWDAKLILRTAGVYDEVVERLSKIAAQASNKKTKTSRKKVDKTANKIEKLKALVDELAKRSGVTINYRTMKIIE